MFERYRAKLSTSCVTTNRSIETVNRIYSYHNVVSSDDDGLDRKGHFVDACDSFLEFAILYNAVNRQVLSDTYNKSISGVIERSLRAMNRLISDRVTKLWRNKDSGQVTIKQACILYREVKQYVGTVVTMLEEFMNMSKRENIVGHEYHSRMLETLMVFTTGKFAHHIYKRIERKICTVIGKEVHERIDIYLKESSAMFLKSTGLVSQLFSCTNGSLGQQCENLVYQVMKSTADNLLLDPLADCNGKAPYPTVAQAPMKGRNSQLVLNREVSREVLLAGLNCILGSFLATILHRGCPFDESGVYKLFRVVLRYQEYVLKVRNKHQHQDLATDSSLDSQTTTRSIDAIKRETFFSNKDVWRKTEFILEALNRAVFATDDCSDSNDSGNRSSVDADDINVSSGGDCGGRSTCGSSGSRIPPGTGPHRATPLFYTVPTTDTARNRNRNTQRPERNGNTHAQNSSPGTQHVLEEGLDLGEWCCECVVSREDQERWRCLASSNSGLSVGVGMCGMGRGSSRVWGTAEVHIRRGADSTDDKMGRRTALPPLWLLLYRKARERKRLLHRSLSGKKHTHPGTVFVSLTIPNIEEM